MPETHGLRRGLRFFCAFGTLRKTRYEPALRSGFENAQAVATVTTRLMDVLYAQRATLPRIARSWAMKLPPIRVPSRIRFCCDCGETLSDRNRPKIGGPRCLGCRAIANPRPGLVAALALTAVAASAFTLGRIAGPTSVHLAPTAQSAAPGVSRVPENFAAAPKPPEPPAPCGGRTKKGTRCKRLVRGGGRCWQHGGERRPAPSAGEVPP